MMYFALFVQLGLVWLSASSAAPNPNESGRAGDQEWQWIYYQLYNNKSLVLKPEETLAKLGQLASLYEGREELAAKRGEARELLALGQPLEASACDDRQRFVRINQLIEHYDPLYENIVAYLEQSRQRVAEFCLPIFESRLGETVARINEQTLRELEILVEGVAANTGNATTIAQLRLGFSRRALELAIESFLENPETNGRPSERADPKRVARLCARIGSKLIKPMQLYDQLIVDLQVPELEVSELTLEWLSNLKVCSRVLDHFETQLSSEEQELGRRLRKVKILAVGALLIAGVLAG